MCSSISSLVPRPVRDFFVNPALAEGSAKILKGVVGMMNNQFTLDDYISVAEGANAMENHNYYRILGALRVTLAAAAVFAVYKLGLAAATVGALVALSSLPTATIIVSGICLTKGVTAVIASLSSGALLTLVKGLALGVVGYVGLEVHDRLFTKLGLWSQKQCGLNLSGLILENPLQGLADTISEKINSSQPNVEV
jgi:hypothetical protein